MKKKKKLKKSRDRKMKKIRKGENERKQGEV
jgi:hypothetical protein